MTTMIEMRSGTIGIREAKAQFSRLVADAKSGGEWVITEHGVPVAKLSALSDPDASLEERISRLESWGWIETVEDEPEPFALEPVRARTWTCSDCSKRIGVSDPAHAVVYWDASALLSALIADVHSDEAIATARRPLNHLVSTLAFAEVLAVIARAESSGSLGAKDGRRARQGLRRGPWRRLTLQPDWAAITALAAQAGLRGADLWHLASVSTLTRQLPETRLFSFDGRLSHAAAAIGLRL